MLQGARFFLSVQISQDFSCVCLMKLEAHAKINWNLKVLGLRSDGYHELKSVVLPIPLHDTVTVEPDASGNISVFGCAGIPQEKNLAWKAACELKKVSGTALGARISIEKRIPAGGGLGGGSADAAAVLNALNSLWRLEMPENELCAVAARVGSDVPALVLGGPVMMEGRGERVRRIAKGEMELPNPDDIEVYNSGIFVSTPEVFKEFREEDSGLGVNDLQPAAIRLYPQIADALKSLEARGLSHVAMSGSGSTVYGVRS